MPLAKLGSTFAPKQLTVMRQAFETHRPTFAHKQLTVMRQTIRTHTDPYLPPSNSQLLLERAIRIHGSTSLQKGTERDLRPPEGRLVRKSYQRSDFLLPTGPSYPGQDQSTHAGGFRMVGSLNRSPLENVVGFKGVRNTGWGIQ